MTKQELDERARLGRPPLPEGRRGVNGSIRLTPARWAKFRRLGGAWLNRAIDRAKEPKD